MAPIIERIDLGCASNLMRVLISLTAALPKIIRASRDHLPQLGLAALPVHNVLSPEKYLGQIKKGM